MQTAIVLFTRDLRVHDHPALSAAARDAERIVPLFVLDDRILQTALPSRIVSRSCAMRSRISTLRSPSEEHASRFVMAALSCRFRPTPPASGVVHIVDGALVGRQECKKLDVAVESAPPRSCPRLPPGHGGSANTNGLGDVRLGEPDPRSQDPAQGWLRELGATRMRRDCRCDALVHASLTRSVTSPANGRRQLRLNI